MESSGPGIPSNGTPSSRARTSRSRFALCAATIGAAARITQQAAVTPANTEIRNPRAEIFFIRSPFVWKYYRPKNTSLRAGSRLLEQRARLLQELRVRLQLVLQNLRLLRRHFPVARFGSFRQSRQLQMRVGVACR